MVQITFTDPNGQRHTVEAELGLSVMEIARRADIEGIIAECGGSLACATCHCFFDDATIAKIGAAEGNEDDMLDFAETERRANSRLSCQVKVTADLDGAEITVPEAPF